MSPPTAVRPPSPAHSRPLRRQIRPFHVFLVVTVAVAFVPLSRLYSSAPQFIERIFIENPTDYHLSIEVTGVDRDGWVPVSTARRNATTVGEEILDVGEVWIFRFAAQGEQAGELRLTRTELERADWLVRIPARVGDELRAKGAPLQP